MPNLILNRYSWLFRPNLPKAGQNLLVQARTNEHYHRIPHIQIAPDAKFHLKQNVLMFLDEFSEKGYFQYKIGQINITIYFSMKFHIKQVILTFWTKFAKKKGYFQRKWEKVNITTKFTILALVNFPNQLS